MVSKDGNKTSLTLVEGIMNKLPLTNITEVQRFLGMANFYQMFIPNFATLQSY